MLTKLFAVAIAVLFFTFPSRADIKFVAADGSGTACSRTVPCADLSTAVENATVGDTIVCQSVPWSSPNAIVITKSLTIDCSGARGFGDHGLGSVLPAAVEINIEVSADDPMRTVRLRGLTIDAGRRTRRIDYGIDIRKATAVYVEDCVISNARLQGILDRRTGGQTRLYVTDSTISGNEGAGIVARAGAVGIVLLENVKLLNNAYGIAAATGNNVIISRSTISGNTIAGVEADGGAQTEVSKSTLSHNNIGVQAFGTIRLRENDVKFSNTAIQGATVSFGANRFSGNGAPGTTPSLVAGAPADLFN